MARTDFTPPPPDVPATGNDPRFFRFFDATAQAPSTDVAMQRSLPQLCGAFAPYLWQT